MIHTIVHTWKKLAVPVAFLAFFLLLGVTQASAQSLGHRTAPNPESHLAQKFGVAAYNMGTWNAGNVAQILIANTPAVKDQTNAPLNSRVTYAYYKLVISDIKNFNIAPEVALLTNLQKVQEQFKSSAVTENNSFLSGIYNSTIALF
jgi:hypothetical protein